MNDSNSSQSKKTRFDLSLSQKKRKTANKTKGKRIVLQSPCEHLSVSVLTFVCCGACVHAYVRMCVCACVQVSVGVCAACVGGGARVYTMLHALRIFRGRKQKQSC